MHIVIVANKTARAFSELGSDGKKIHVIYDSSDRYLTKVIALSAIILISVCRLVRLSRHLTLTIPHAKGSFGLFLKYIPYNSLIVVEDGVTLLLKGKFYEEHIKKLLVSKFLKGIIVCEHADLLGLEAPFVNVVKRRDVVRLLIETYSLPTEPLNSFIHIDGPSVSAGIVDRIWKNIGKWPRIIPPRDQSSWIPAEAIKSKWCRHITALVNLLSYREDVEVHLVLNQEQISKYPKQIVDRCGYISMIKSQHPEYYLGLSFLAFLVFISACFVIYFSVFAPELIDSDSKTTFCPLYR